jgi:integrase
MFPSTSVSDHVSVKSISKQINDRQRVQPMKSRSTATNTLSLSGGKWTPHDLRRTGATMMGELGARPDVIERCLNHVEHNRVKRIYQRQQLISEQADAWRVLGEKLASLTSATRQFSSGEARVAVRAR